MTEKYRKGQQGSCRDCRFFQLNPLASYYEEGKCLTLPRDNIVYKFDRCNVVAATKVIYAFKPK